MSWIKQADENVEQQEEMGGISGISKTDAYELEITEMYLKDSEMSKSMSVVVNAKTDDNETVKSYFTVQGKDGLGFYEKKGKKYEHFGIASIRSLIRVALDKDLYDVEPTEGTYKQWDNEKKEMVEVKGRVFAELIGIKVGGTVQMTKTIAGADSKLTSDITHFFDLKTGLFANEEHSEGKRSKLDKWLNTKKEFKIVEEQQRGSSFGKKKEEGGEKPKSKWSK